VTATTAPLFLLTLKTADQLGPIFSNTNSTTDLSCLIFSTHLPCNGGQIDGARGTRMNSTDRRTGSRRHTPTASERREQVSTENVLRTASTKDGLQGQMPRTGAEDERASRMRECRGRWTALMHEGAEWTLVVDSTEARRNRADTDGQY